jgi:hypothetical protein
VIQWITIRAANATAGWTVSSLPVSRLLETLHTAVSAVMSFAMLVFGQADRQQKFNK